MQEIKRTTTHRELRVVDIRYYGFNSNGILTVCLDDDTILNFNEGETKKLRSFLMRIDND
jgi:hypothetical protein